MKPSTAVPVPVVVLAALVDAAESRAAKHYHRNPNHWPDGVPCKNCTALTVARPLVGVV